jgi:GNAT superfamily N-acetyltransferase
MFELRKATRDDIPEIQRVMRESLTGIARRTYDARQIASALEWIAHPDTQLIDDGTYFVAVADGAVVACGGWSRRGKLYAGSADSGGESRLLDPATEPARVRAMFTLPEWSRRGIGRAILERCESEARAAGFTTVELMAMKSGGEALYATCGYERVEETKIVMGDGVGMETTVMRKALSSTSESSAPSQGAATPRES